MVTAVDGYYDGTNIIMNDKIALKQGQKVTITFDVDESENLPEPLGYYDDGKPYYRQAGIFKGKGWISDDFDAPLEEFKEYIG